MTAVLGPSGADFSPCRTYRYKLWRVWDAAKPLVVYVMLNPSTADAAQSDPTLVRCETRARATGYGGLVLVNLFAYCATDPRVLKQVYRMGVDIVGRDNDATIADVLATLDVDVVVGWGNRGNLLARDQAVLALIRAGGQTPRALAVTKAKQPQHPLYVPYSLTPQEFRY